MEYPKVNFAQVRGSLTQKHQTWLERLASDKLTNSFDLFVSKKEKKF